MDQEGGEALVISLRLQSGEKFDGVPVADPAQSLAEFLDSALKQLEDMGMLQLPDSEDPDLIDPAEFKVHDEQEGTQLDLAAPLSDQPFLARCRGAGQGPVLLLCSRLFLSPEEVAREAHADRTLRRQTLGRGDLRAPDGPPTIPERLASRSPEGVMTADTILYLAGRGDHTPSAKRIKKVLSPLEVGSLDASTSLWSGEAVERLFESSSEDASSLLSSASGAESCQGRSLPDRLPLTSRPGSASGRRLPLTRRTSDPESLQPPRDGAGAPSSPHSARELGGGASRELGSRLGPSKSLTLPRGTKLARSPPSRVKRGFAVEKALTVPELPPPHAPVTSNSSCPVLLVSSEDMEDEVGEGRGLERGEGQGLATVEEAGERTSDKGRLRRSLSPPDPEGMPVVTLRSQSGSPARESNPEGTALLEQPMSPTDDTPSPGAEGKGWGRKSTRVAQRRKLRRKSSNTPVEVVDGEVTFAEEEEREGGGGGGGGGGEMIPKIQPSFDRRQRTIYDRKSRKLVPSTFFPLGGKVFGNIRTFSVNFDIPIAEIVVEMSVRGDYTVGQIKDNLWTLLRDQGLILDEYVHLWDPDKFTFSYELNGEKYELYDEQQIFQTSRAVQLWRTEHCERGLLTVELKQLESKEEKTLNMEIGAMVGIGLYQLQFANNDELDITRRKMVAVRRNAVRSRDPCQYSMETELNFQVLSQEVKDQIAEADNRILVRVYYTQGSYQTFREDVHMPADDFLPTVIPAQPAKRERLGIPADCDVNEYVLKVSGQESYIHGSCELLQFSYIVRCVRKREDIELSLVRKKDSAEDKPRDISTDWNLIDDATGLTGTHYELSALSKEHTQVFTMSMWDIHRKFRVRVVGLDNLHGDSEVVYVEAGIYHGADLLVPLRYTSEISVASYPRWNQWLVFDIAVKNLPKAARLCVQVVGGTRVKDVKRRSLSLRRGRSLSRPDGKMDTVMDKPLHWVNMQILDHRALLRQGLLRLNLWPVIQDTAAGGGGGGGGEGGMFYMRSTAFNPDGNTSTALYLELDTYAHPVACPTGGWGDDSRQTHNPEPSLHSSRFSKDLKRAISADPLTPMDKAQRELVWKFRSHCSTIPEAMPKFLHCINWADLEQVCEAHRLIDRWCPVTLEVGLELLDHHFADERVRALAVRRLEHLSNDELQCFLLQLIQVLKFEPYHDSALARFLLKRALQSTKIGHYFYWYLRSEMDTPEFNQRFGILLEAYLRGCGEAVFRGIQRQHTAVCNIMQVAERLKKHLVEKSKGTVLEFARAELARYLLPDSFAPPYNPALTMGKLNITKSKVMDSKKSPLWLEFSNMDTTAVVDGPIRVIAKHGDDLRQDMLTLQMLSLMDKLWQSRGLDLYIISYGCIATGHEMGMIQVVPNAETVARIQQKHGGSFSALKEEPLDNWLRQQNPTEARYKAAVERFLLSCAGYCVATYVLGIGDRHNDNIMVTTSGNLFHIDFGHFLGNKKEFFGVNRERAPFVLTPDFEYVMGKRGSEMFRRFEATAVEAYLIIRENANLFINLFSMMKCTGIPELRSVEDIDYLREVLVLGRSSREAEDHFKSQILKCLKVSWSTQLNWLTHNIVHSRS